MYVQSMGSAFELRAPALHEFPIRVEHDHGVVLFAGLVHGVMDKDVPLRILAHTVRVAVGEPLRQLPPIGNHLVLKFTRPDDRVSRFALAGRNYRRRHGQYSSTGHHFGGSSSFFTNTAINSGSDASSTFFGT